MEARDLLRFFSEIPQRPKPIYYILIGKKTFSNLLAAKKYHYLNYFYSCHTLDWALFVKYIQQLKQQQLLAETDTKLYLTPKGLTYLQTQAPNYFQPKYYNGLLMPKLTQGLKQLHLGIQVISEFEHHNKRYIPITTDFKTQNTVRQWFHQIKTQTDLKQHFKNELTLWLTQLPADQANFVAMNFSGYQFGFSQAQLAQQFDYSQYNGQLIQLDALANLLDQFATQTTAWPLCRQLVPRQDFWQSPLSRSTQQTYQLFQQGETLAQISQLRHLKAGTIREHILEIVLLIPEFNSNLLEARNDLPADDYFKQKLQEILELKQNVDG